MNGPYDDILYLPHHVSATRPHMPIADRAAQFSPFAALTGHDAAIKETARLTDTRINLEEDAKEFLRLKLNALHEAASEQPEVAIIYFRPDERKDGGSYITFTGKLKRIDTQERIVMLTDGSSIPIEDIVEIESEWFNTFTQEG